MNDLTSWAPVVSAAGAIVSALSFVAIGVIGWLVKYVLANTERRIAALESKVDDHDRKISTASAHTDAERREIAGLVASIEELRRTMANDASRVGDRISDLSNAVAKLTGEIRRKSTPPYGVPK